MTEKIGEETYERLHAEWQEKIKRARVNLRKVRQDTSIHVSDLDLALALMTNLSGLFQPMKEIQKHKLLQILVKRIIVNSQGKIVDHELHSPFEYLKKVELSISPITPINSSGQVKAGVHEPPENDLGRFFSMIRFDAREKLEELPDFQLNNI